MTDQRDKTETPMRLVVYCDEDLGVAGGGSRQVLEFVRTLSRRGYEICLIAPKPSRDPAEAAAIEHVLFRQVPVPRLWGLRPFAYLIASGFALGWTLMRWRPHLMLWFDTPGQVAPLFSTSLMACPYLLFVNGLSDEEVNGVWRRFPFRHVLRWSLKVSIRQAAAVVSVCPEILAWIQKQWDVPASRCRVVRNGVDEDRFRPEDHMSARRMLGLQENGPYIGFVGGFFPWHGLETLLEAVPLVLSQIPDAKFLLVGDGHRRPVLEVRAKKMGLMQAVRFVGRVPFEEVPCWISACDVCMVLHRATRSYPGDSMKLWEYLACGRPVLTTEGSGYGDMVEAIGCGWSVKPNDPADVAQRLVHLLRDEGQRLSMGQRGREAVLREHTWKKRAVFLDEVLRALLAGRHDRSAAVHASGWRWRRWRRVY